MHHAQNRSSNFVDKANGLSPLETVEYSGTNRPLRGRTNGVCLQNCSLAGSARRQCVLYCGCLRQAIGPTRLVAMIRWLY